MTQRCGDTLLFRTPPVIAAQAAVGGKKEGEGPLAAAFDELSSDNRFGQSSWEAAEKYLQLRAARLCLQKAQLPEEKVRLVLAGDLQAQCTASGYALRELGVPFAGLFGACSTMAEALALGAALTEGWKLWLLIPLAMLMGWFIINAEPAVHILNRQVEDLSAGAISAKAMGMSLSIAVSAAGGLAMLRVITGVSIMYFLVPGYFIALALSFFVPRTFTAIAFDSGGVASGPLTATFMLPFAMGACEALGGNVMTDAFGLVALVAMMPLITVQVMGAIYVVKSRRAEKEPALPGFGESEIIELWEAC